MNINDKINALVSIKHWAVSHMEYDFASRVREVERSLLEIVTDYVKVIKPIQYLSNEQKEFLLDIQILNHLPKERLRDLKLILILP